MGREGGTASARTLECVRAGLARTRRRECPGEREGREGGEGGREEQAASDRTSSVRGHLSASMRTHACVCTDVPFYHEVTL
jgi:hypothetical protein